MTHPVLPIIQAPMFLLSGPEMVIASAKAGIIGSFPTPNTRTADELEQWLITITTALDTPKHRQSWAINLIMHPSYPRRESDLELAVRYRAPIVITALGSPKDAIEAVHSYGGKVYADVITLDFAKKAAAAGVDGLALVCAGAGGHTGFYHPSPSSKKCAHSSVVILFCRAQLAVAKRSTRHKSWALTMSIWARGSLRHKKVWRPIPINKWSLPLT